MMADGTSTSMVRFLPLFACGIIALAIMIALLGKDEHHQAVADQANHQWLQNLHRELNGKSHWERVVALRSFAHKTADLGEPAFHLSFKTLDTMSLATLHEVFRNDLGAVMCGGKSIYLMKLYKEFGYRTWSYDVGEKYQGTGGASHQFNLVEVPVNGDTIISVQDAYFNHTYVDAKGKQLDIFAMLQLLKSRKADSIFIKSKDQDTKIDYLTTLNEYFHGYKRLQDTVLADLLKAAASKDISFTHNPAGFIKIKKRNTIDEFRKEGIEKYYTFLDEIGYPPNFLYLFLFPKSVTGPGQKEIREKIDSIIAN